ncbi:hypothetical protein HAX54_029653 [Datura stramonium]|uniref:PPPDE domain-containing protein n=1 Tax=Datura stramonium TaxID=4076 RepID=A0ABS8SAD5_DATST|nr:hypothetical protein [Datura stramonium]
MGMEHTTTQLVGFEVEPRSCPEKYHGDSYHLIAKNCNHFADEVCSRLTGKPIPGWVNRLARVGSFCNCILPESIQVTRIRHLPDHQDFSEDGQILVRHLKRR